MPAHKLSDEQLKEIRASRESSVVLSFRFGVTASSIRKIRGGEACLALQREAARRWREKNPGSAREANAKRDPAKARERMREKRLDPAEAEKARKSALRWCRQNVAKVRTYQAKRRAVKRGATVGDPKAIAAVFARAKSPEAIPCTYCGKKTKPGRERHVDHAIPLARGGAHAAENFRIACAKCNLSKHTKTEEEFRCQR